MDKIKKIFTPGTTEDHDTMYGDEQTRRASATAATGSGSAPQQLHSVGGEEKSSGGVLRQIINPGGEKYDDQAYGTTATTQKPQPEPGMLQTHPEAEQQEGGGVMRQILNPNNEKYDPAMFNETAATTGDRKNSVPITETPAVVPQDAELETKPGKKDHSILRQIFNPHGDKYDEQGFGSTARVVDENNPSQRSAEPVSNQGSSITRQILNPGGDKYDPVMYGTPGASAPTTASTSQGVGSTTQTLPDRTTTTGQSSTLGRDAAIAGTGAAVAGGAGYAATRDHPDERITDRGHPLSDRSGDTHINPVTAPSSTTTTNVGSSSIGQGSSATAGGAHINPVGAPEESLTSGGSFERNAAVGTGVAGVTGAGAATQLNSAPSDVQNATYTERTSPVGGGFRHTHGPHQTDIANVLDPHVPGEFPAEDGTDRHGLNPPPLGDATAIDGPVDGDQPASTKRELGAATAGAAGLAGAGAVLAATQGHSTTSTAPTSSTSAPSQALSGSNPIQTTTNTLSSGPASAQGTSSLPTDSTTQQSGEHHYGRDAGIAAGAAGAGAAGYGAYEATQGSQDTGPASKTLGPHDSNIKNILDPRVKPEPEGLRALAAEKDSTTGRDAALAGGGAAAAGAGTYAATQHQERSTLGAAPNTDAAPAASTLPPQTTSTATTSTTSPTAQLHPSSSAVGTLDDSTTGRDAALLGGGAAAAGAGTYAATQYENRGVQRAAPNTGAAPAASTQPPMTGALGQQSESTAGRDAALVGGGAAAAGAGTYAATPHGTAVTGSNTHGTSDLTGGHGTTQSIAPGSYSGGGPGGFAGRHPDESTAGRDAALVGGGAAAAGAGTSAATKYEEQPRKSTEAPHSSKHKDSDPDDEKGEKKHGLLHKILHPGERKKEKEEEKARKSMEGRGSTEDSRTGRDAALVGGGAAAAGAGTYAATHEQEHGTINQGSLNHPLVGGADLKEGNVPIRQEEKAASSIPAPKHDDGNNRVSTDEKGHNKLHKKSVEQTPATTAMADQTTSSTPRHMGTDGAIGRDNEVSGVLGSSTTGEDAKVIEPHTGLPMNVGKYGTGSGGTDGAQQISGYHETDPAIRNASIGTGEGAGVKGATTHAPGEEGVAGPDWEAIKKANTPY